MRWRIVILLMLLVLTGCTREIIREKTIIRDSSSELQEKIEALTDKITNLEEQLAETKTTGQGVSVPQEQIQSTTQTPVQAEIPPAPLTTNVTAPILTPDTIIVETNKTAQEKAAITELLAKADSRVKSYSFIYSFLQTDLSGSTFYIKNNKMKIKLKAAHVYNFENYFDTVYLDMTTKTARGYCENIALEACRKGLNEYNLSYVDYKIKTPFDWLEDLKVAKDQLKFNAQAILFERNVILLQNNNIFFWIDEFSGLPMRIKIRKDTFEEIHDYRHLSLNYLSESDVIKE